MIPNVPNPFEQLAESFLCDYPLPLYRTSFPSVFTNPAQIAEGFRLHSATFSLGGTSFHAFIYLPNDIPKGNIPPQLSVAVSPEPVYFPPVPNVLLPELLPVNEMQTGDGSQEPAPFNCDQLLTDPNDSTPPISSTSGPSSHEEEFIQTESHKRVSSDAKLPDPPRKRIKGEWVVRNYRAKDEKLITVFVKNWGNESKKGTAYGLRCPSKDNTCKLINPQILECVHGKLVDGRFVKTRLLEIIPNT